MSIIMVAGRRVFLSGVYPQRGDNVESPMFKDEADVLRTLAACRTEASALGMGTLGLRLF